MTPDSRPSTALRPAAPAAPAAPAVPQDSHAHGPSEGGTHSHAAPGGLDLDRVGAAASFVCAVHCAAIPVLMILGGAGVVPMLGSEAVGWVEWAFVGVAAVVATTAAWRGWRTHGRVPVAIVLAGSAIALVGLMVYATLAGHGAAHEHDEVHVHEGAFRWLFPALGLTVACAHLWNRRLLHRCACAH